ncbi:MAG: regulator SirB [Gammaproteobacteria bacterium HGW-Gammaproteobacteria-8]|nr:MAG: regulator SirB [Gammaproteobacteria bacterium HGW-Gammaproteobacteria-8]
MQSYALLKSLHIALAFASGLGFALRGYIRLVLRRPLQHPALRWGPHLLDTLLLASGATLWWLLSFSPLTVHWFGYKLLLIVVYILLGVAAFRSRQPGPAVLLYLAALGCFFGIAWLALMKPV